MGDCGTPTMTPCGAYNCKGTVCGTMCGADTDCQTGNYCKAGACVAQGGYGAACSASDQCTSGHCWASSCAGVGDVANGVGSGPQVTAPGSCAGAPGSLIAAADAVCNTAHPGTHWCTLADYSGTGSYHADACASNWFQFNGNVTCNGGGWYTDEEMGCGMTFPSPPFFVGFGATHEVDCCN
jgi:hypothetical protein